MMFLRVDPDVVVSRLEELLPGLRAHSREQSAAGRARMGEIWARAHPDKPLRPALPWSIPGGDEVVEHAQRCGAQVSSFQVDFDDESSHLPETVLAMIRPGEDDVLVVSDEDHCYRVPAARMREFVDRDIRATGDLSFNGDELFICSVSRHVVVVHHEGWVFDVVLA